MSFKVVVLHQEKLKEIIQELYKSGHGIYALAIEHLVDEGKHRSRNEGQTFDVSE